MREAEREGATRVSGLWRGGDDAGYYYYGVRKFSEGQGG